MPARTKTLTRVSVYVGPELDAYLARDAQASRSARVNALADRYQWLIAEVRLDLSEAERNLIRDACNGSVYHPAALGLPGIALSVADSIRLDGADKTWGVDGPALVAKLRALSRVELAALAEEVEAFWGQASAQGQG